MHRSRPTSCRIRESRLAFLTLLGVLDPPRTSKMRHLVRPFLQASNHATTDQDYTAGVGGEGAGLQLSIPMPTSTIAGIAGRQMLKIETEGFIQFECEATCYTCRALPRYETLVLLDFTSTPWRCLSRAFTWKKWVAGS